jgi:hypothetical protein
MKRLFAILSATVFLAQAQTILAGLNTNVFLDPPFNGTSIPVPQPPAGPVIEDPAFDIYCDRYKTSIDLRTSTNQVVNQISRIWIPKYRYWQCASDFWIWVRWHRAMLQPGQYRDLHLRSGAQCLPADCNGIPGIVTNPKTDLATAIRRRRDLMAGSGRGG